MAITNPSANPGRRVAVVHDWLTGMRGGEKVLEAILAEFPGAEVFTLFHFEGSVSGRIESHPIHTSVLQRVARRLGDYRRLLPLFPAAVARWDLDRFDLVISSSHCVAKGVATTAPHVCYCHTPMRYVWDRFDDYFPPSRPFVRLIAGTVAPALRRWDVATAGRVDRFVANSSFVRERIRRFYGRDAVVVHPFVDDAFFQPPLVESRDRGFVIVSALVPYKRIEVALDAATIAGRRLVVIGEGPLRGALSRRYGNAELAGPVDDRAMVEIVRNAVAFILPGIEDFGIAPVEAMALGTPVVAARGGGAADTVVEGRTGLFFDGSADDLAAKLDQVERREWDRDALRRHAARFSRESFRQGLLAVIRDVMEEPR